MKITLTELRQMVRNIINESRFSKPKFPFMGEKLQFNYGGKKFEIVGDVYDWDEVEFTSIKIDGGKDISYYIYNDASDEEIYEEIGMSLRKFEDLVGEKLKKNYEQGMSDAAAERYSDYSRDELMNRRFNRYGDY